MIMITVDGTSAPSSVMCTMTTFTQDLETDSVYTKDFLLALGLLDLPG